MKVLETRRGAQVALSRFALALALSAVAAGYGTVLAAPAPTRIAVLGLHFENTSLEPTRPDEVQRMAKLNEQLASRLDASPRFEVVPVTPEVRERMRSGPQIGACGGCELEYGRALGATEIAWGNVQKVSNLILNINVYIDDVVTGRRTFVQSVDIRGNDDRSWSKGLASLIDNHLLAGESR